jgi:hypothetical protein
MLEVPEIQSVGLPPEKHADRVVLEMMKFLAAARQEAWPGIKDVLMRSPDGNPKAQAKMLEKLKAAAGPFMFWAELKPGKRGRYKLYYLDYRPWNPETKEAVKPEDMVIPEMPWVAFMVVEHSSKGDHRYEVSRIVVLLMTHHALSRLTQRCGARTIFEVWKAACEIVAAYINAEYFKTKPRDNSRFRVSLPDGMGTVICVLRSCDNGDVAVVTLWREGEIPDEAQ